MKNTVVVKAIKRGSRATRVGIIHLDPKGHERARKVEVPRDVAEFLENQGLGKALKTVELDREDGGETVHDRGARVRRDNANAEDEQRPRILGATGGDTRDTTAFERDPTETGRSTRRRSAIEGAERNEALTRQAAEGGDDAGSGEGEGDDSGEDQGDGSGSGEDEGDGGDAAGGDAPGDDEGDDAGSGEGGQAGAAAEGGGKPAAASAAKPATAAARKPTSARARAAAAPRSK